MSGRIPPLTAEEAEHYRWLIDGLLHGAERLTMRGQAPSAVVAIEQSRDLFAELMARIQGEETHE